ncbi:uncharacterized protein K452DRAFT_197769, partial [Aplosporella prunicola CBS 121167]
RGGRGGGGGGRGKGPLPRDVLVSKKMSRVLRHAAEAEGLTLGPGGYVNVQDLLNCRTMRSIKATFPELRSIVSNNDKQRFSLIAASTSTPSNTTTATPTTTTTTTTISSSDVPDDANPAHYLIRANQGHSLTVEDAGLLTPLTPASVPPTCVHGTVAAAWPLIRASGGLKRMARNHIHFAAGLPKGFKPVEDDDAAATTADAKTSEAPAVISGMRATSTILIYVDVAAALDAGIPFFQSANGVILSPGDEAQGGVLGLKFFKRVEDRRSGRVLVRDG